MSEAKELMVMAKQKYQDLVREKAIPETTDAETQTEVKYSQGFDFYADTPPRPMYAVRSAQDEVPGFLALEKKRNRKLTKPIKWIPY